MNEDYEVRAIDTAKMGLVGVYAIKAELNHYKNEAERLSQLCKELREKKKLFRFFRIS